MIRRGACKLLLGGSLLILAVLLSLLAVWLNFKSSNEFNGRYQSSGRVILSDGRGVEVSYSLLIKDGRFYSLTRHEQTLVETSGTVESGFLERLRLRVEKGKITDLQSASGIDNDLMFNLLYSGEVGSIINVRPIEGCLFAVEIRQVFCPEKYAAGL